MRKKSTGSDKKGQKNRESFVAKDLTFNQQQLIELQTKVKHGEISQAYVVAQATEQVAFTFRLFLLLFYYQQ